MLETVLNQKTLIELNDFDIGEFKYNVTFFGTRTVQLPGSKEIFNLDVVATRLEEIAENCWRQNGSLKERKAGIALGGRVSQLYSLTDQQLKTCSFVTRLFAAIRAIVSRRKEAVMSSRNQFSFFSKQSMIEAFGEKLWEAYAKDFPKEPTFIFVPDFTNPSARLV